MERELRVPKKNDSNTPSYLRRSDKIVLPTKASATAILRSLGVKKTERAVGARAYKIASAPRDAKHSKP